MQDWGAWDNEPILVDLIVLAGWLYALFAGPLRERFFPGQTWPRRGAARFYGGLILLYLVVGAPWELIGRNYLFSAALLGHLVIVYPAAGLMLSGLPAWMGERWFGGRAGPTVRTLLHPVVCGALFVLVLTGGYLPRLYEWALEGAGGLALEHGLLLLIGLLFWRPILGFSRELPALRVGPRLAYLFAIEVALTAVFTFLLMADHAIYPSYELAPRLIAGLSALDDQILAGVILSLVSSFVLLGALGQAFFSWSRQHDEAARRPPAAQ